MKNNKFLLGILIVILLGIGCGFPQTHIHAKPAFSDSEEDLPAFEADLDTVRQALKIPGMSAVVVQDQEVIWSSGFGYANKEQEIPATPDTPYGLASVTKPVAAVVIMQLVEEGLIDLDTPVSRYGVHLVGDQVTVRHLLSHTSEGIPGTRHNYNGNRYGYLAGVIENVTGKSFAEVLCEKILHPLGMTSTALNPINSWGGTMVSPWSNFRIALGWGADFQHFGEVYANQARPYQFDDTYNIIPGMYQIYHNTAAGLISSVVDLAKFDIALDSGYLLDDATKAEMVSPAVPTSVERSGLNYGLGWYIQDFEGLRMLWHTGRWPPSTSALYVKIPEKGLTFIVLANTDNLTVPFNSIGDGDVSKSTLVLTFFRHFIYPAQYGSDLPKINWGAPETILVKQLKDVSDNKMKEYLERELWSFRQAYASSGMVDQADKLWRVSLAVYPGSRMRRDGFFTHTVGQFQVVAQAISAAGFQLVTWVASLWSVISLISLLGMGGMLLVKRKNKNDWFLWLLGTLFLGPVALLGYGYVHRIVKHRKKTHTVEALRLAIFESGPHTLGWAVAMVLLVRQGSNPHPLLTLGTTYFLPLLAAVSLHRVPLIRSLRKTDLSIQWRRGLLPEFIANNVNFGVMFPLMMILNNRILTVVPDILTPYFWIMISTLSLVDFLMQWLIQTWMISRGAPTWKWAFRPGSGLVETNRIRSGWQIVSLSGLFLVGSLIITITQFA